MKNRKLYVWLLALVFVAMVALCAALNLTGGQEEGFANLMVNVAMFAIVAGIFISCYVNSFKPMDGITDDLDRVSEKIRNDF